MIQSGQIGMLSGLKVIIQPPLKVETKRGWKERLFTRPWRPLKSHNISFVETVEDGKVIKTLDSLIMNIKTHSEFKKTLDSQKKGSVYANYRAGCSYF